MKTFYEEWSPFLGPGSNFAVAIAELPSDEILQLQLQKAEGFPVEEFLSIGFTLRSQILTSAMDYDERVVEQAIVNNVKNFIMEFGRGFSFIGNAYHLDAFGEDQFIDLLFFNRDLNCLVAVELKRGKSYGCASLPQGRLRQPRTKLRAFAVWPGRHRFSASSSSFLSARQAATGACCSLRGRLVRRRLRLRLGRVLPIRRCGLGLGLGCRRRLRFRLWLRIRFGRSRTSTGMMSVPMPYISITRRVLPAFSPESVACPASSTPSSETSASPPSTSRQSNTNPSMLLSAASSTGGT